MRELDLNPFFLAGGPTGCLLIHGFSGSPPEMRSMEECLAQQGLTVRRKITTSPKRAPKSSSRPLERRRKRSFCGRILATLSPWTASGKRYGPGRANSSIGDWGS